MKLFISADVEGVGGVVRGEQSGRDASDYAHARMLGLPLGERRMSFNPRCAQ
jgi:D-aminopeptidase